MNTLIANTTKACAKLVCSCVRGREWSEAQFSTKPDTLRKHHTLTHSTRPSGKDGFLELSTGLSLVSPPLPLWPCHVGEVGMEVQWITAAKSFAVLHAQRKSRRGGLWQSSVSAFHSISNTTSCSEKQMNPSYFRHE